MTYEARVYPHGFHPRNLAAQDVASRREDWFTFFALAIFRTLGRAPEGAHRSFVTRARQTGWWQEMAEAKRPNDPSPWLLRLEDFARADAIRIATVDLRASAVRPTIRGSKMAACDTPRDRAVVAVAAAVCFLATPDCSIAVGDAPRRNAVVPVTAAICPVPVPDGNVAAGDAPGAPVLVSDCMEAGTALRQIPLSQPVAPEVPIVGPIEAGWTVFILFGARKSQCPVNFSPRSWLVRTTLTTDAPTIRNDRVIEHRRLPRHITAGSAHITPGWLVPVPRDDTVCQSSTGGHPQERANHG